MARKSYLMRRQGRWSYNRAFPKDVWPVVGTAPFRLALGTDSLEEAQRRRGAAEQRFWAAVDEARKKLGEERPRALSDFEAIAIVSRWFVQRNAELDHGHLHQPTPAEGWQDAVSENEFGIHYATERLKMSDVEAFAPLAARVLAAEALGRPQALSNEQQESIRSRRAAGLSLAALAKEYGVSRSAIQRVQRRS